MKFRISEFHNFRISGFGKLESTNKEISSGCRWCNYYVIPSVSPFRVVFSVFLVKKVSELIQQMHIYLQIYFSIKLKRAKFRQCQKATIYNLQMFLEKGAR